MIVVVNEELLGVRRNSALVGSTHTRVCCAKNGATKKNDAQQNATQLKCNHIISMVIVTSSLPWTDSLKL